MFCPPNGLSGNDDYEQMSAWLTFCSIGFYPVCPGSGEYVVGSPLFSKITLNLQEPFNRKVLIKAPGVNKGMEYIKSLMMDGKPIKKPFIKHTDLVSSSELVFGMSETPTNWGK